MGTATAWAGEQKDLPIFENDKDIIYTYRDLPAVAQECADHGIDELVLWIWGNPWHAKDGFQLPLKTTFPGMGTLEDLADAVKKCKAMKVNVTLFISVLGMREPQASRFGVESKRDVVILLSAAKPVSINLISDLKKLVNEKIEEDVTVAVYAFQEAGVKRTEY